MQETAVEKKVDKLEQALMEMVYQSRRTEMEIERVSKEVDRLSKEMRDFKDEMRAFKDEMKVFKDEMLVFKDKTRELQKEMNRKWGDLANQLGTIAEDIVAPGVPQAVKRTLI